jgi:hypothetical protein
MKRIFFSSVIVLAIMIAPSRSRAGLLDQLGLTKPSANQPATNSAAVGALSNDQVVSGLKEALGNGLQHAVAQLGHDGGFLTNAAVKIPMPEKLRSVEKTLRALKQDKMADDFVATMNHAAEQAVPEATSVFVDAVKQMSIADAKAILTGPDDSATQYFRRATGTNLFTRFHPIVQKATGKAGVTAAYKNMMSKAGSTSLGGKLEGFLGTDSVDLDSYVTSKALDGLFKMVADEEKKIRANPAARTSELLQKVFGAVAK